MSRPPLKDENERKKKITIRIRQKYLKKLKKTGNISGEIDKILKQYYEQ